MPNKPQYITNLESEVENVKKSLVANEASHDKLFKKLDEIHVCLAGTDYDKEDGNGKGGGVVRRLGRVEKKVTTLQIWRTKTITTANIIWIVVGGALTALWSIVIANWNNIFNGQ
jgi:hypothetical protein